MPSAAQSMATIDQFINTVTGIEKTADGSKPLSEAGSIGGETEHPVKKVDDRLEKVKEGERFKENTKDVNEDQGAPGVQKAPEAKAASVFDIASQFAKSASMCAKCGKSPCMCNTMGKKAEGAAMTPGSAADDQMQIGTNVQATGDDPKNETSSAKAGKDDKRQGNRGGTSHPASTENNSLDGHKYAADMPLEKLAQAMKGIGDDLCAQISWVSQQAGVQKTAQAAQAAGNGSSSPPNNTSNQLDPQLAHQAGWELSGLLSGTMDKAAADQMVKETLYQVVKTASDDADRFLHFANVFFADMQKQAEGAPPEMPPEAGGAPGAGGMPPGAGDAGGGGQDAMMAALGGGAAAGGPPPGGDPSGGDPSGSGGGGQDAEAQQLAMILEHLGVTPEQLQQAMMEEQGGGGAPPPGGAPPGAGGPPPGGDPSGGMGAGGPGMEAQAAAGAKKNNNGMPAEKKALAQQYISEIIQRSRARR